jgi:F0F1-type ATP synthase assembly protein I
MPNKEPPGPLRLIRLGTTMAALVAGGVLIGWFVDTRAHTLPAFTLTGLAVGMAATCWYGYAMFRRFL